ncbi:hypothetical protein QTP86_004696 [Hemibagrus guttatus]|nr:hypothetical protein QTP86_004696 [Hemibagrus guttatus]
MRFRRVSRPQSVRLGNHISSTLILNTGVLQGCVLSPLLYSLCTHDCVPRHNSNIFIKYADDTTGVGRISNNNESAYREEIQSLSACCSMNNLTLNATKTKELIVDFWKSNTSRHSPIYINGSAVELWVVRVVLSDDWETTAEVIRETGRKVLGVSSGRRKEDKETWWWNEEVQDSIQRKRLAKKKWDMDRTEENRHEYKELQRRVKREVSKAKQKAYDELYTRLDTREGEKDLYRLARQRD